MNPTTQMVQVNSLEGAALDWAVAHCQGFITTLDPMGFKEGLLAGYWLWDSPKWNTHLLIGRDYSPSSKWEQGGPILQECGMRVMLRNGSRAPGTIPDVWDAEVRPAYYTTGRPDSGVLVETSSSGPTPLVAMMRCYVKTKVGAQMLIPVGVL